MTWFVIFAACVFAVYFWLQHREREREKNSPLAGHRSGHSHIGQVIVLEQGLHQQRHTTSFEHVLGDIAAARLQIRDIRCSFEDFGHVEQRELDTALVRNRR